MTTRIQTLAESLADIALHVFLSLIDMASACGWHLLQRRKHYAERQALAGQDLMLNRACQAARRDRRC
jgi:hypothetical protein